MGGKRPSVLCGLPCNDRGQSEVGEHHQGNKQCGGQIHGHVRGRRSGNSYRPIQACNNRRLRQLLTFRMEGSNA